MDTQTKPNILRRHPVIASILTVILISLFSSSSKNSATTPAPTPIVKQRIVTVVVTATDIPLPSVTAIQAVEPSPTNTSKPTIRAFAPIVASTSTPYPTAVYIAPISTSAPAQESSSGGYGCNCSRTCSQMSCDEAYYQLNQCGCSARDGDGDGVPCEAQCR
ncbi:hypothetical protein BH09PAT2_BH09PAT2_04570 [soil metagenome]